MRKNLFVIIFTIDIGPFFQPKPHETGHRQQGAQKEKELVNMPGQVGQPDGAPVLSRDPLPLDFPGKGGKASVKGGIHVTAALNVGQDFNERAPTVGFRDV